MTKPDSDWVVMLAFNGGYEPVFIALNASLFWKALLSINGHKPLIENTVLQQTQSCNDTERFAANLNIGSVSEGQLQNTFVPE